jgi:predicted dehydrogenase
VAFVGCAHPHIVPRVQILSTVPDVRLVGCYDPDARLTATLATKYGLRAFASAAELLDQPGVTFAILEGWDTDNPRYARAALQRNQAILLEKPGAPNLGEMRALLAEVRGRAVPF